MTKTGGEFKWIVAFVKGDIPNADAECTICAQAQPLKTKEKLEYILAKALFKRVNIDLIDIHHKSKTWGPLMATVTYEYNLAVHSATRKSPFELFMKRRGCNNVIDQTLDIEEASNTSEEESICTPDENEFSVDLKYLERMDRKCRY
ncbi:hypothetical protein P3W45_000698 [Vairimorpha bombi]